MQTVERVGIVCDIRDGVAEVVVARRSGCGVCASGSSCAGGGGECRLTVDAGGRCLRPGDPVTLLLRQDRADWAVLLAFVFPLVVFVAAFFVARAFLPGDGPAGLVAFFALALYFLLLRALRGRLEHMFPVTLK